MRNRLGVTVERSSVGAGAADSNPRVGVSSSSAKERKLHWFAASLAVTAYALCILSYRPFADLTYGGDDFAYAWTAYRLVLDGKLVAANWVAAAAVPQMIWAAGFCKIFSLSYRMLNVATMVAAAFGPVLVYWLGIEMGSTRKNAALIAVFAIVNPMYMGFASSFMSDGYYAVLMLGAVFAYSRGLRRRSLPALLVASCVASVAVLQRQIGIATPAAVVFTLVLAVITRRRTTRQGLKEALAAALIPAICTGIFRKFPNAFGGVTPTQLVKLDPAVVLARYKDVWLSITSAYTALVYIAVLLLPLVVAFLPTLFGTLRAITSRAACAAAGALVAAAVIGYAFGLHGDLELVTAGEFLHPFATAPFGITLWKVMALPGSLAFALLVVVFAGRTIDALRTRAEAAGPKPAEIPLDLASDHDLVLTHVFVALTLALHVLLVATFIAFYNNYFVPLVLLGALLVGTLLSRSEQRAYRAWLLPGVALVFTFVWSTLNLDLMCRFVEADERFTQSVIAKGTAPDQVFDYEGSFARHNYQLMDVEIAKDPWSAFPVLRRRATMTILYAGSKSGQFPELLETRTYSTLAGTRALELRGRALRKRPAKRAAPVH